MKKLAVLASLVATPVLAHPGHDAALSGASHWVFSPIHGLGVIALACVVAVLRRRVRDE